MNLQTYDFTVVNCTGKDNNNAYVLSHCYCSDKSLVSSWMNPVLPDQGKWGQLDSRERERIVKNRMTLLLSLTYICSFLSFDPTMLGNYDQFVSGMVSQTLKASISS